MADGAALVESIEYVSAALETVGDTLPLSVPPRLLNADEVLLSIESVAQSLDLHAVAPLPVDVLSAKDLENGIYEIVRGLAERFAARTSTSIRPAVATQKLIGRHLDENLHSDFIAALLSTSVVGGFAAEFLAQLTGDMPREGYQFAYREVRLDELDPGLSGRPVGARRLDVLVKTPEVILVIENKIGSKESERQTQDYGRVVRDRYEKRRQVRFVLLSPSGMLAENSDFQAIDYLGLYGALVTTKKKVAVSEDARRLVESYLRCLTATFVEPEMRTLQLSVNLLKERGYEFQ